MVRLLAMQHGSEKNWFKVLGGMTIAVTIEKNVFKANLIRLLRNTVHYKCSDKLIAMFTEVIYCGNLEIDQ